MCFWICVVNVPQYYFELLVNRGSPREQEEQTTDKLPSNDTSSFFNALTFEADELPKQEQIGFKKFLMFIHKDKLLKIFFYTIMDERKYKDEEILYLRRDDRYVNRSLKQRNMPVATCVFHMQAFFQD